MTTPRPAAIPSPGPPRDAEPPTSGSRPAPERHPPPLPSPRPARGTFPRRIPGRAADGRRWELLTHSTGITVATPSGTVAEASIQECGEQAVVDFWADATDLPDELSARLVGQAFAHPALQARRPVLVSVPQRHSEVLRQAQRHVAGAQTRVAGVTCLIEGRVATGFPPYR